MSEQVFEYPDTTNLDYEGWAEVEDGVCPVEPDVMVDVRLHYTWVVVQSSGPAHIWNWGMGRGMCWRLHRAEEGRASNEDETVCEFCHQPREGVEWCNDPFLEEVYGKADEGYWCPQCYAKRRADI